MLPQFRGVSQHFVGKTFNRSGTVHLPELYYRLATTLPGLTTTEVLCNWATENMQLRQGVNSDIGLVLLWPGRDCGCRGHVCLSLVSVVCCQAAVYDRPISRPSGEICNYEALNQSHGEKK